VDRQLEVVKKKVLMLQKEKERFASQLEAKKKSFRETGETQPGKRIVGKNAKRNR
jgi:hypothetical protein